MNPPGYAVGWGALALINAGLAQGKHRSGLIWFLVSLFVGPFATLLIVILPPGASEPGAQSRAITERQAWALTAAAAAIVLAIVILAVAPQFMSPVH